MLQMWRQMKTTMITEFYKFLDEWNRVLGYGTPEHHRKIMRFLVDVWESDPHRGL